MPDEIMGVMAVKNGQKQTIMNLSNARQKSYADLQSMTDAQKKGVIICPDYPKEEFLVTADEVSYGSGTVKDALDELGVVKNGTITFTTDDKGTWAGTVTIGGYPLKAGELLSTYLDRGSLSVVRKIEPRMYGYGGYLFICTDGSGNPIANTEVSVTCVYLKTP
jgi:hypothetical protein